MAQNDTVTPKVTIYAGTSKKNGRPYKGVLVEVGEWSQLIFPKSSFETQYLEKHLETTQAKTLLDETPEDDKEGYL